MSVSLALRAIIRNHVGGRETRVSEIAALLSASRASAIRAIKLADQYLNGLGYAICPISSSPIRLPLAEDPAANKENAGPPAPSSPAAQARCPYTYVPASVDKCDSLYIRKTLARDPGASIEGNLRVCKDINHMLVVFSVLHFEGGETSVARMLRCFEMLSEHGMRVSREEAESLIKRMLSLKYLRRQGRDKGALLEYGWKFFVEFVDFNPEGYFN